MKNALSFFAHFRFPFTLSAIFLLSQTVYSQARMEVFITDDEPFYLIVNGKKINDEAATNASTALIGAVWSVKVKFVNEKLDAVSERIISTTPGTDMQFELVRENDQYKLRNLQTVIQTKALIEDATRQSVDILLGQIKFKKD